MAPPPAKTKVNVPIKISIGPDVDGKRLTDAIANATGKQLGRALGVLDDRGDWHGNVAQFDVQFTGNAASLPDDRKRELYGYVGDGVTKGAEVAQTRRKPTARKRSTQAKKQSKADVKPAKGPTRALNTWHEFDAPPNEEFDNALLVALSARFPNSVPAVYGVLFRLKGKPAVQLWVVSGQKWVSTRGLSTPTFRDSKPGHEPFTFDPGAAEFVLEREPRGLDAWREAAYKTAETDIGSRRSGTRGDPRGVGTVTAQKDITEPARDLAAEARAVVDEYSKDWPTRMFVYYRLSGGEVKGRIIPYSSSMPTLDRIDVVALVDRVEVEDADQVAQSLTDGTVSGRDVLPKEPPGAGGSGGGQGEGEGAGAGKGLGSDVTAPAGQDVGEAGPGIVIAPEYKKGGSIFPMGLPSPNGGSSELACEPYHDEPSVWDLGAARDDVWKAIAEIAARLDMVPCEFPANFCIQAARMVRLRTAQVQDRFLMDRDGTFTAELAVGALDPSGRFVFRGIESVGIQYLQHLAATIPKIRYLIELVRLYTYPRTTFSTYHWFEAVFDEATQACGHIFLCANQFMMQQLLASSRYAVEQRQKSPEYPRVFAVLCRTHLADQVETMLLRTSLDQFEQIVGDRKGQDAYLYFRVHLGLQAAMDTWRGTPVDLRKAMLIADAADADLATKLADETEYVFRRGLASQSPTPEAGGIVETTDGGWAIRASDGRLYRKDELNAMIELRQKVLVSIDPLINQLLSRLVSAIRPLVDDPEQIPGFLENLFREMLAKNDEVSGKNRADFEYAFEHAQIHQVDRHSPPSVELAATQVWGWQLSGVHSLAHLHVGVHFKGDPFYLATVDRLIGQEYYWKSFVEDMIFIFGTALTIICPPLGAAVSFTANLALGLKAYAKASEQATIYGALIEPEDVLNYAEIQVELFLAKLQIGLSFLELIPYAGKGAKALTGVGKRAVKEGAQRGIRQLAKEAVINELERIAKISAENFVKALAVELVEESIENEVVDILVTPIINAYIEDLQKEIAEGRQ